MASVNMGMSRLVLAAKAEEKQSFFEWLDNAFHKKDGFSETSKVLIDLKAGKAAAAKGATSKKPAEKKKFWEK